MEIDNRLEVCVKYEIISGRVNYIFGPRGLPGITVLVQNFEM